MTFFCREIIIKFTLGHPSSTTLPFHYKNEATPTVLSISPDSHHNTHRIIDNPITIVGMHFSSSKEDNIITFGGFPCTTTVASSSSLTCNMDIQSKPSMNTWLLVKLKVKGKGDAPIAIAYQFNASVIFQHTILTMSPTVGSFAGGTHLTFTGYGLDVSSLKVIFDVSIDCPVVEQSYSRLICTPPSDTLDRTSSTSYPVLVVDSTYPEWFQQLGNYPRKEFSYEIGSTPEIINISPNELQSKDSTVTIIGTKLGYDSSMIIVKFGNFVGATSSVNDIGGGKSEINVLVSSLPAGNHDISVYVNNTGDGYMNSSVSRTILSKKVVDQITPSSGSIYGETEIRISGFGFFAGNMTVQFQNKQCVIKSTTGTEIVCTTPPIPDGTVAAVIEGNSQVFPSINFEFSTGASPTITSITPSNGKGGDHITLSGTFFGTNEEVLVTFGGVECTIVSVTSSQIICTAGTHPAGDVNVECRINGYGKSNSDKTFSYDLGANEPIFLQSGYGGGLFLQLTGYGFSSLTTISICDYQCPTHGNTTYDTITCTTPIHEQYSTLTGDVTCDIVVSSGRKSVTFSNKYTYKSSLTTTITNVSPRRSGTGGGVVVTITGTQFLTTTSDTDVTIAGVPCSVNTQTTTEIQCVTGPSPNTVIGVNIKVEFKNQGMAVPINASFDYVDVWSSIYSWGGREPPIAGKSFSIHLQIRFPEKEYKINTNVFLNLQVTL